jgi:hypothetical protein
MDTDPAVAWSRVRVPVLLLKGAEDDRSPPGPMAARIGSALRGGHDPPLRVDVVAGADHMLLDWPLGPGIPPPRFAGRWTARLAAWIHTVAGPRRTGGAPDRG